MNTYREENSAHCYFHPKEVYVGVCPLCLNERLLVLASKQSKHSPASSSSSSPSSARGNNLNLRRRNLITLPKIFAFGSFLNRRHRKFNLSGDLDTSTSQEDSFISIKFEDNGNASWEKNTASVDKCRNSMSWNKHPPEDTGKSVIEHRKSRSSLRWRKRIGHLFQLIRLRGSTSCHVVSKVEGVKVRRQGWMVRTLTRRKPNNK
ncbi:PREDICTED: uncharacterized protein LOC104800196 [Tarenaya hassleriana]|uniref:uncharacterized protein LOC104800196 n=1 Tax=Tarenaya hassleriana TaxID=28532 RepID=UPI00053C92DF|nr:PREDICTED: uncharacterized protein LOC104800196 [Tarenaya hassleriana]